MKIHMRLWIINVHFHWLIAIRSERIIYGAIREKNLSSPRNIVDLLKHFD